MGIACWACGGDTHATDAYHPLRLVQCSACGLRFTPERDADEVHELYRGDQYFHERPGGLEPETLPPRYLEAAARVRLLQHFITSGRVLEIGAAGGFFMNAAQKAGFSVEGIEPTDNAAMAARERFGFELHRGFVEDVSLDPASFDAVVAWHVLEHITEPLSTLERVRGWLRPGGVAIIEVPNIASSWAQRRGLDWLHLDPAHHVAHYTPLAAGRLFERAGFVVRKVRTVSYTSYRDPSSLVTWASGARNLAAAGAWPWRPHPYRHELLQLVASA
jgi:2-polyprenyl-3-methyl-5-hydroxy-6-metoxy-1,4-benzoquinol methylase